MSEEKSYKEKLLELLNKLFESKNILLDEKHKKVLREATVELSEDEAEQMYNKLFYALTSLDAVNEAVMQVDKESLKKMCENFNKNFDKNSVCKFKMIVLKFLNLSKENEEKLTKAFGISKSTVKRWAEGRNAPLQALRPVVIQFITRDLQQGGGE